METNNHLHRNPEKDAKRKEMIEKTKAAISQIPDDFVVPRATIDLMGKFGLEMENHKIGVRQGRDVKILNGWEEIAFVGFIYGKEKMFHVLRRTLAPDAYVREFQDDGNVPWHLEGEQLFNWKAVHVLGLEKRLPTQEQIEKEIEIRGKNGFMSTYFKQGEYLTQTGCRDGDKFCNMGQTLEFRQADSKAVILMKDGLVGWKNDPESGCLLRLMKK